MTSKKVEAHTRYKLQDDTQVPGVTTICNLLNKPALVGWANNLGLKGIQLSKYMDELASIGNIAHEKIQCELQGKVFDSADFTANQLDAALVCVDKFYAWKAEIELEPMLIEKPFISEIFKYGGTLDFYGTIKGKKTLLDWKTGAGFYEEHKIQLAANKNLLEEHGYEVEQCMLVGIGRNKNEDTHEIVVNAMDLRFEKFKHLLDIYWIDRELKIKK